jgi:hypothetical protein
MLFYDGGVRTLSAHYFTFMGSEDSIVVQWSGIVLWGTNILVKDTKLYYGGYISGTFEFKAMVGLLS